MDLQQLRNEIDAIDEQLICLLEKRMDLTHEVAVFKHKNNIAVYDATREQEILDRLSAKITDEHKDTIIALYKKLFELSRAEQERIINPEEA